VVDDVGNVINPLLVKGQVMGGIAQGIGEVLLQGEACDAEGQVLVNNAALSRMPSANCQRVPAAGIKPADNAVDPRGTASRSSTATSAPAPRAASAAQRPAAPPPTMTRGMLAANPPAGTGFTLTGRLRPHSAGKPTRRAPGRE
jgi:CO/xanthine dehydrogenase Mo-binding subunit